MERRKFLSGTLAGGAALSGAASAMQDDRNISEHAQVVFEREQSGQPHKGKVLAAIQPHADDIPEFSAGLVLKLIKEGYTGILIRSPTPNAPAAERRSAK